MSTPKATTTQAEIRRCLIAAREAGIPNPRVEIEKPDGTRISVSGAPSNEGAPGDDLDELIERAK